MCRWPSRRACAPPNVCRSGRPTPQHTSLTKYTHARGAPRRRKKTEETTHERTNDRKKNVERMRQHRRRRRRLRPHYMRSHAQRMRQHCDVTCLHNIFTDLSCPFNLPLPLGVARINTKPTIYAHPPSLCVVIPATMLARLRRCLADGRCDATTTKKTRCTCYLGL